MKIKKGKLLESKYVVSKDNYNDIKNDLEDDDVIKIVDESETENVDDVEYVEYLKPYSDESPFKVNGKKYVYCWGLYPSGKVDVACYSFSGDVTYGYKFFRKSMFNITENNAIISKKELFKTIKSMSKNINESNITYDEKHAERMHPGLAERISRKEHSLGKNPIFPDSDEQHFEEKLVSNRFNDLLKNYKKQFNVESIGGVMDVYKNTMSYLGVCLKLESEHKKELVEIAIDMVREEFDIDKEDIIIDAELTTIIDDSELIKNDRPSSVEGMEFEDHKGIENVTKEVYKRRFINSMIQGSSKKCSHMFHMVEDKLSEINPRLNTNYSKMMAGADYMYYMTDEGGQKGPGGLVNVEFPTQLGEPAKITAKAFVFPILIHEIVKGVMEILSSHGLPENKKITEYVLAKADFTGAELDDMRLGPAIWERFVDSIDNKHFSIKHHIYSEIVALPVDDFNDVMREIMAGTKSGKKYVKKLGNKISHDISTDTLDF